MTQLRRVRAGFTVSVVAGGLWALAGGVIGAALILQDATGSLLYTLLLIAACAAVLGFIGLIGGGFFATILAARGGDDGVGGLSRRRVILAGALGGIAVQLLLQYVVLPPFLTTIPEPHPIGRLISWSFFGGLGALTGLAILGTAKRAALAAGEDDPNRLAP